MEEDILKYSATVMFGGTIGNCIDVTGLPLTDFTLKTTGRGLKTTLTTYIKIYFRF